MHCTGRGVAVVGSSFATSLIHVTRCERNWTNYYYVVGDTVPSPASPRVWQDSFYDIAELLLRSTQEQFDFYQK